MRTNETAPLPFFVAGGTVPPGSPSYVERLADRELYDALLAGEFCYVLNSRQMGKSSLAVRTIDRLVEAGERCAFVDLTRVGGATVTPEQWYAGLLLETGRAFGLRAEAAAWLKAHRDVGPAQRLLSFLHEEVLGAIEGPVVLMVDEIDAVRSLSFSTDELFAGFRQLHNGRASDPDLRRLTVCLLGAALPSDLIRDPRTTPFNVGRRIELRDFTPEEARPFAMGLASPGEGAGGEGKEAQAAQALARVLHWTGGHPFLTQVLCAELASPSPSGSSWRGGRGERGAVDALVQSRYLDARARETDTNLTDVGRRLLGEGDPNVDDAGRADTLSLYGRMLRGKDVDDDEANPAAARIKMSGVARVENGSLKIRNRIYARAFDSKWVREAMPGQELRRQRKAFWRGALRAGLVGTAVTTLVGVLAFLAVRNAERATRAEAAAKRERDDARYDTYLASMQTMLQRQEEGNGTAIRRTLADLKDDPARGWEWDFWNHVANHGQTRLDYKGSHIPYPGSSPKSPYVAVADADALYLYDAATGRRHLRVALPHSSGGAWMPGMFHDGSRILAISGNQDRLMLIDLATGRILRDRRFPALTTFTDFFDWDSADDRFTIVKNDDSKGPRGLCRLDLATLDLTPIRLRKSVDPGGIYFDRTGLDVAWVQRDERGRGLSIRRLADLEETRWIPLLGPTGRITFSPTASLAAVFDGRTLALWDLSTGRVRTSIPFVKKFSGFEFSADGGRLLVSPGGRMAEEYEVTAGGLRPIRTVPDVFLAGYVPGNRLFANGDDVRLIDPVEKGLPSEIHLPGAPFGDFAQGANDRAMLRRPERTLVLDRSAPFAPRETHVVGTSVDHTGRFSYRQDANGIAIADLQESLRTFRLQVPKSVSTSFPMSASSSFAADAAGDRVALILDGTILGAFDTRDGRLVQSFQGLPNATEIAFSPDGRRIAAADQEGDVALFDVGSGRRVASAALGRNAIRLLAFSDDSLRVAAGMWFGDLGILDVKGGKSVRLLGASQDIYAIAWSHDGRRLAAGGADQKVRLWDATTGRELGVVGTHAAPLLGMWFTKGGRTLCSVDNAGTLKLWPTADRL